MSAINCGSYCLSDPGAQSCEEVLLLILGSRSPFLRTEIQNGDVAEVCHFGSSESLTCTYAQKSALYAALVCFP